jgi:hypothetical protein
LFSLLSSYPSTGSLSSPFPCNSGWGSELHFACATVRALLSLPVPTILPPKTGLYDICRHLFLTFETIVFKLESLMLGLPSSLSLSSHSFSTCVALSLPMWLRTIAFFQTLQPDWNAYRLFPFRVTPQSRHRGGERVIYACYCFRTFRPLRCFRRGNTHQFGVTFSPKESFQEISKILLRVYPGMSPCSASLLPALLTYSIPPFRVETQS